MSVQTSIDGFRLIAERTGKYAGQLGPFWCGMMASGRTSGWTASRLPPPRSASCATDFKEPLWGVARFASYCQKTKRDGA
jgi:hypothetical protein